MRRACLAVAAVLVLAGWGPAPADTVQVYVDAVPVVSEVPARIVSGRTFLPLRGVAEALGLEVGWDDAARTVLLVDPRAPGHHSGPDLPLVPLGREAGTVQVHGGPAPAVSAMVAGVRVALAADGTGLTAYRGTMAIWRLPLRIVAADVLTVAEDAVYLAYQDRQGARVRAVDLFTGDALWRRDFAAPATALLPWGEVTLVAAGRQVHAFAGALGTPVAWASDAGEFAQPVAALARRGDALAVTLADGRTELYGPQQPAGDIRIRLGGRLLYPDVAPFVEDGRTLVPLRVISEALGAQVSFDAEAMTVRIMRLSQE